MGERQRSKANKTLLPILVVVGASLGFLIVKRHYILSESPNQDLSSKISNTIPLAEFKVADQGARIEILNGRLHLKSLPRKGSIIASVPLGVASDDRGLVVVLIKTKILAGEIVFGVESKDRSSFVVRKALKAGVDYMEVNLNVPSIENAGQLIIQTWADDGQISKAIVEKVEISNSQSYQKAYLQELIAKDYPMIKEEIDDWTKINILRQWVSENADWSSISYLVDSEIKLLLRNNNIIGIFDLFKKDKGGVWCGGIAIILSGIYELYGFDSYTYNFGVQGVWTHIVTLVKINNNGNDLTAIQDAYFDLTYLDSNGTPYDFIDFINTIKSGKYELIKTEYGKSGNRDFLIHPNEIKKYSKKIRDDYLNGVKLKILAWAVLNSVDPTTLQNGCLKYRGKFCYDLALNSWRKSWGSAHYNLNVSGKDKSIKAGLNENSLVTYLYPLNFFTLTSDRDFIKKAKQLLNSIETMK